MLNEERVKHMVKLALYESKNEEEFEIHMYEKKAYAREKTFVSLLWVTLAYALLMVLLGITYIKNILDMPKFFIVVLVILVLLVYCMMLIGYSVYAKRRYRKKYITAKRNVKRFARGLEELEKMYEREEL